jgi:hypothetical protein
VHPAKTGRDSALHAVQPLDAAHLVTHAAHKKIGQASGSQLILEKCFSNCGSLFTVP